MEATFCSTFQRSSRAEPLLLRTVGARHRNRFLLPVARDNKFSPLPFAPTGYGSSKIAVFKVLSAEKGQVHVVEKSGVEELYDELAARLLPSASVSSSPNFKHIVGLAGPPGAGKSTLAHEVVSRVNKLWPERASSMDSQVQPPDVAIVVPMDGFHLYRSELDVMENPEEAHARRGAPWTFNPSRLLTCLKNLKIHGSVYVPSFDHGVGDPLEDDIFVNVQHKVVIVEGNYLLLEDGIWKEISCLFDEKWQWGIQPQKHVEFIDIDIDKAMQRVLKRHISTGKPPDIAKQRIENNDRLNAELIMKSKKNANIIIKSMGFDKEGSGEGSASSASASKQKSLEEWLPITASRNAKWWYSAFHNLTAMVGAGVLSLPGLGITVMILSWVITLYTLWQMVEMHEMVPGGKRLDRYHELGQEAFGEKLGLWIVVPQQLLVEVGTCIVYMVTGGKSIKKVHETFCPECTPIKTSYWIMVFASVNFVLAQLPNFNSISAISLGAAVMSLTYSFIAWGASIKKGITPDVSYNVKMKSTSDGVLNFFSALGDVAFAYAGHNVVLEIQATMPSTAEKPSKVPMWKGCIWAYIGVAICYFPVAFVGYYMFGNMVDDNILITLEHPAWLIAIANLFVVIHVVGGYQLPCIIWLKLKKPRKYGLSWTINWICIVIGVLIMTLSPIEPLLLRTVGARHRNRFLLPVARDNKFSPLPFAPTGYGSSKIALFKVLSAEKGQVHIVEKSGVEELYDELAARLLPSASVSSSPNFKHIVGLAGPPGAGKSTLAHEVVSRVNKLWPERASSMDSQVQPPDVAIRKHMPEGEVRNLFYSTNVGHCVCRENTDLSIGISAPWTFNPSRLLACFKNLKIHGFVYVPSFDHGVGDPVEDDIFVNVQ
ncbi:hypothetical protein Ahy_B06g079909 isoform D [Arachis hypogaea]|uniref:Amino acid transporter transmembrane domain-containing protein n=1 Tax=Arachis hypogaea TaxID=3818 RepID=A0A444YGJ8_ARAHY|nr:hypothetical protein Ahy_B06g079909 isoform D [Arachis hypogaea]